MPASRYSAGALRMMRGSTSTREVGVIEDLKIQGPSGVAVPHRQRRPRRAGGGDSRDGHQAVPPGGGPALSALSSSAPPPTPITTARSSPEACTSAATSRSLQWPGKRIFCLRQVEGRRQKGFGAGQGALAIDPHCPRELVGAEKNRSAAQGCQGGRNSWPGRVRRGYRCCSWKLSL